jgi:endonuclease G, mitochondrial
VGRLVTRRGAGFGTGFLISPRLLMTASHVLEHEQFAKRSCVEFDYVLRFDGVVGTTQLFHLRPAEFFLTSEVRGGLDLDYTIVAVEPVNSNGHELAARGFIPLTDASGRVVVSESVNIIQHPGGDSQQVVLSENRVVRSLEHFVHYEADTLPGSSGSPVFNDQWRLVALHHSGVPDEVRPGVYRLRDGGEWDTNLPLPRRERLQMSARIHWVANEGVRVESIVADARARLYGDEARLALFEEAVREESPPLSSRVETGRQNEDGRQGLSLNENLNISNLVESLRRHGVSDEIVASVIAELTGSVEAARQIMEPVTRPLGFS